MPPTPPPPHPTPPPPDTPQAEAFRREKLPACSAAAGAPILNSVVVLDLAGFSLSQFAGARAIIEAISHIDQNNSPELLGRLFLINAPLIFRSAWAVIRAFLDARTLAKIKVLGSDYRRELLELIPIENLPVQFGGLSVASEAEDVGPWRVAPAAGAAAGASSAGAGAAALPPAASLGRALSGEVLDRVARLSCASAAPSRCASLEAGGAAAAALIAAAQSVGRRSSCGGGEAAAAAGAGLRGSLAGATSVGHGGLADLLPPRPQTQAAATCGRCCEAIAEEPAAVAAAPAGGGGGGGLTGLLCAACSTSASAVAGSGGSAGSARAAAAAPSKAGALACASAPSLSSWILPGALASKLSAVAAAAAGAAAAAARGNSGGSGGGGAPAAGGAGGWGVIGSAAPRRPLSEAGGGGDDDDVFFTPACSMGGAPPRVEA